MQRIGATQDGCQRLHSSTHNIIIGLLCCKRDASRLRMTTHHPRARILRPVALLHQPGPQTAGGPKFGNLFKKVVMDIKEEGKARSEFVDLQATLKSSIYVGQ